MTKIINSIQGGGVVALGWAKGMALNVILRDLIGIIKNTKESKYVIKNKTILINNKKARDYRMNVGLFDVITIPDTKENYRMVSLY